jgi:hypothetical protein
MGEFSRGIINGTGKLEDENKHILYEGNWKDGKKLK